ncbi:PepSY domain-containing protein [Streptomyces albogriseolus]|uniref:PepSY domain-containing protein n=1 Tax=Streptomyces albogriseolus TaxID=1887 RepID=UPI003D73D92B
MSWPTLVLGAVLLASCSGPPPASRPEVLGQVEFSFDRAVREALDEVPRSKLFSVEVRQVSGPDPVWRTEVATDDGTLHVVRIDASLGRLLDTFEPPEQPPARKARTAAQVKAAKVLPEEAAEKADATAVENPHYGKVTALRLTRGKEDEPVWSVAVMTIRPEHTHIYQVDAVTGDVIDRRTTRPGPSPSATAPLLEGR